MMDSQPQFRFPTEAERVAAKVERVKTAIHRAAYGHQHQDDVALVMQEAGQPPVASLRNPGGPAAVPGPAPGRGGPEDVSGVRPADARWRLVTGIADSQPGVAAVDEQVAALAAERRAYFSWVRARADEHTLAAQQHAEQVEQALRRGKVPPPEPVDPWPAERHTTKVAGLVARERELADARQQALAAARDQVLDEARTLYDEVIDEARPHVDALVVLVRRALDARSAVQEAEHAHDAVAGVRRHLDWGPTPQVGDLVSAVQDGRDLLSPTFLPARGRLGLSGPGWRAGDPQSHQEPPLPPVQRNPTRRIV